MKVEDLEYSDSLQKPTDQGGNISLDDYKELIVQIRRASIHFQQLCHIPTGELTMLLTINRLSDEKPSVIASDLGNALNLSRPAVSRMLHILEKKGYIQMKTGTEDHRYVLVEFTEQGRQMIREELDCCCGLLKRVTERMGEENMHDFLYYNNKFCSILSEEI